MLTETIRRLNVVIPIQKYTPRDLEGPVAMECGDTLVLRGESISGASVEGGARRGVGGVKLKERLQVSHRGAGEKVPRDIVRKFIVGAGTRI